MFDLIIEKILSWKFDPFSSFVTVVVAPLLIYAGVTARRFLKDALKYFLDGVVYTLNKVVVHRLAATLTLKRYARLQLAGPTKYLRVPAAKEALVEIDSIFVPLVLEGANISASFDHKTLLTAGNRIRLIGDPGSGKSSATKRIFRDECNKALGEPGHSRLPIFIELRTLDIPKNIANAKVGDWMFNYVRGLSAKHDVYNLEKCFDVYANRSGLLLILDGLDEVSSSAYPKVQLALNGLSAKLHQLGENNAIILTLRTQFHQQIKTDLDEHFPVVLSVKRFAPSDIYEFLTRWPFQERSAVNAVRIYNDLTDRPTLREMCTNPLVLSMYVAQDQSDMYRMAPDSRTEFYAKVADELLVKRRAKQIGPQPAQAAVREQRQRILGRIAFQHLCDPDQSPNHLGWSDAVSITMDITKIKTRDGASSFLRDLAKETGLIGEEQEGESFRFIHLTFCEFFCAHEAVQGSADGWLQLLDLHSRFQSNVASRSRLVEAVPFAAALLPRHMREAAIDRVARIGDRRLMAMTFLETKGYGHPFWNRFIEDSITRLVDTSVQVWDAEWLRELHLFLVVASDAERSAVTINDSRVDGVAAFFEDFASRNASLLSKLIKSYAEQDAAAAFRVATLCEVDLLEDVPGVIVDSCAQPPFVAIASEQATGDSVENTARWACLFAEAGLRSQAAQVVLSARVDRPWQDRIRVLPPAQRWSMPPLLKESFYTDCVTLAYHANSSSEVTPLLSVLRSIPPPNSSWLWSVRLGMIWGQLALISILVPYLTIFSYIMPIPFSFLFAKVPLPSFLAGLLGLVLSAIFGALAYFFARRVQLYQALMYVPISLGLDPITTFRVMVQRVLLRRFWAKDGLKIAPSEAYSMFRVGPSLPSKLLTAAQKIFAHRQLN